MYIRAKKRLDTLLDTLSRLIEVTYELENWHDAIQDSLAVTEAVLAWISSEGERPRDSLEIGEKLRHSLVSLAKSGSSMSQGSIHSLRRDLREFKVALDREIKVKLNVAFFPYKISMWDSLESIYRAALRDTECVAKVVPIPYYELTKDDPVPRYEGDRFPADVPIVHYASYSLEEEQPDVIFVHNIYDQYNTLTRVHDEFFTSNLKKFTDMLVYVPYNVASFVPPKKGEPSAAYTIPTVPNVDKIVVMGDYLKKAAIRDGVPPEKLLALGTPKLDRFVRVLKDGPKCPPEWESVVRGRVVYLLDTGCLYFANGDPFEKVAMLTNLLNITNMDRNSALIWRPHPLTRPAIRRYTPYLLHYYDNLVRGLNDADNPVYPRVIFDKTSDYMSALAIADVLIAGRGSLLSAFLLTERKVLYLGDTLPEHSLVPSNAFYYYRNETESWYETVKMFMNNNDPLAQNRKGLAKRVYANVNGTSGETIYGTIKDLVLMGLG